MRFVELNQFIAGDDGVFRAASNGAAHRAFNYSDGAESEQSLFNILSNANDLSSHSEELNSQVKDWATEYHLSSVRANLLRCLDLSTTSKVLELGCGCGAISRYLGEAGLQVDAVEGSEIRAGLAALRCKDLPNVSISTANFNEVAFPQEQYDLVLFVGVTEYAGRFSDKETDQQALQDLLRLAKMACNEDGVVLIAIENRTGLKYILGAREDHYGVPFVGLEDYPESQGIRTYSYSQWQEQIEQSSFSSQRFLYPFPDYKLPTLVLSDEQEHRVPGKHGAQAISKISSRDYLGEFEVAHEGQLWQSIFENKQLKDYSNSFLILLANSDEPLNKIAPSSIVNEFDDPKLAQNYLVPKVSPVKDNADSNAGYETRIKNLRTELAGLEQHAACLEEEVSLIKRSRFWKIRSVIRSAVKRLLPMAKK